VKPGLHTLPLQDVILTVRAGGCALVMQPNGELSTLVPARELGERVSAAELIISYISRRMLEDSAWVEEFIRREGLGTKSDEKALPEPTVPGTDTVN
jgi:hypothetical protein